jgi:hypothetical protein
MVGMRTGVWLASIALLLVGAACGDDSDRGFVGPYGPYVGGPCIDDLDCVSGSFCVETGDYPDGMCTTRCRSHNDCPGATACIDREGGICALYCFDDLDCRQKYHCKERNDQSGSGKSLVCIK